MINTSSLKPIHTSYNIIMFCRRLQKLVSLDFVNSYTSFKYEAQTALFKDPVRTAQ